MACLDECIEWGKDGKDRKKSIKFNYKYLEDRKKDDHHVLKLIHDTVCLLMIFRTNV